MILILSSIVSSRNRKLKFATCQPNLIKIFHDSRIQNGELVDLITVSHDFLQKKGTLEQASRMKYTLHKDRSHSPHFLNIFWKFTHVRFDHDKKDGISKRFWPRFTTSVLRYSFDHPLFPSSFLSRGEKLKFPKFCPTCLFI